MPNVHTFAIQPMHPSRPLAKNSTGYPMTAQLLQHYVPRPDGAPEAFGSTVPALLYFGASHLRGPRPHQRNPFTCFYYADVTELTSLPHVGIQRLCDVFNTLTHLDLCISTVPNSSSVDGLRDFIMASKGLTHLRLCFEQTHPQAEALVGGRGYLCTRLFGSSGLYLPRLRFLHVVDMTLERFTFLGLIARHASSLESLKVVGNLRPNVLSNLATIYSSAGTKLNELSIIPHYPEYSVFVRESEALDWINHKILREQTVSCLGKSAPLYIDYDEPVYSIEDWKTMAIIEGRNQIGGRRNRGHGDE
ncbi:hypothetical protein GGS23DRAFT_511757 [Durotheca rogersii]|uniref:uncharacterized protein n=1 Tax=Durotheca rogersii TaxID=419775 RepID=UPI0022203E8B|nr:uncharacterized protein GGS23DRAFT_511757 [Durotheca rogersii]KAI5863729.1 hypothetical protein GGS23DRAFT_511757 [Durotheca rogersii]